MSAATPKKRRRPEHGSKPPKPQPSLSLLEHACALITQWQQQDGAATAEQVLSAHFAAHKSLGSRQRQSLGDAFYHYLRQRRLLQAQLAQAPAACLAQPLLGKAYLALQDFSLPLPGVSEAELAQWQTRAQAVAAQAQPTAPEGHNLPDWLAAQLQAELGEAEFAALAQALLQQAAIDLRVNPHKAKAKKVLAQLQAEGWAVAPAAYAPQGLRLSERRHIKQHPLYLDGSVEVQEQGSQLIALLLGAKRDSVVVDYCAGAGGKTLALASQMRGQGRVYALDASASRLRALEPRMQRAGLSNIYPMALQGEGDERLRRLAGKVDAVLVDAPCTGLGTLRRQPDLKWRRQPHEVAEFAALQMQILRQAAALLKPGGRLVYATCSLLHAENEAVAAAFEAEQRGAFVPQAAAEALAKAGVADAASLCSGGDAGDLYLRTWPQRHGMDGFFAALWHKRA